MSPARLWDDGSASVPYMGQGQFAGDRAFLWRDRSRWRSLVVDVSGHGESAHSVAERIADAALLDGLIPLTDLVTSLHHLLRGSIGAAAMAVEVLRVAPAHWRLTAAGVGNVRLWVDAQPGMQFDGQPGLLGTHFPQQVRSFHRDLGPRDRVVLVTDGIRSEAREHIGAPAPTARVLAHDLVHRFARLHDDATAVALLLHEGR